MTDILDQDKENEEYELGAGEEYSPEYEETGVEPETEQAGIQMLGPPSRMRKLLGYAGIGLGALAIALYLQYRSTGEAEGPKQPQVAQVPIPQPTTPVVTPVQQVRPIATDTVFDAEKERLTSVAQQVKTNQLTLQNFDVRLQTIESSITELTNNVKSMDAQIKQLVAKEKKPVAKKKYRKVKRVVVKKPPRIDYSLIAVVPGRAWIQAATGQTRTVRVGNRIAGYGKVRGIYPATGRVTTSSGSVIIYGPNDS